MRHDLGMAVAAVLAAAALVGAVRMLTSSGPPPPPPYVRSFPRRPTRSAWWALRGDSWHCCYPACRNGMMETGGPLVAVPDL